jgi:uncharacterized protein YndB with AHSA1/START domain
VADERTVERTLRIAASPEVVFALITQADRIPLWMGLAAEVDARPGGVFRCAMIRRGIVARGEFLEVDRPHRVVFTWGWEGSDRLVPPGSTRVEFTLHSDGNGTLLTLRHSGLPVGHVAFHEIGWTHYLARMAEVAAGRDPGPDRELAAAVAAAAALPPAPPARVDRRPSIRGDREGGN